MKKWLLASALLALLAGSASAYVPLGKLQPTSAPKQPTMNNDMVRGGQLVVGRTPDPIERSYGGVGGPQGPPDSPPIGDESATRPVPEPGTMVLASMGLIALGAAARKRHGS